MYYPLPEIGDVQAIDSSYVRYYADYTLLKHTPEAFYFCALNQNDFPAEVTVFDVYQGFNKTGLFNPKVMQDVWLDYRDPNWSNVFTAEGSVFYLRYIALNFGLGGLFSMTTPRTQIEGYVDPVLAKAQSTPVYLGGDATLNPWVSIDNNPVTKPMNAAVTFHTGAPDTPELTRHYYSWLHGSNIRV